MSLPPPSPEAAAHSRALAAAISREIAAQGGWVPFERFMAMALYEPGLGYYSAGARKFGTAGDFVTAPEMSAHFGRALAHQLVQVMDASAPNVLEVGAGSGRLAADLLLELERLGKLPARYDILDLSADLRERQRATLAAVAPHLLSRVSWLDRLPEQFSGVVVANELLDAMPAHVVAWRAEGIFERGVQMDGAGGFTWNERPASGALLEAAEEIAAQCALPPGYESEISLAARAWSAEWGHRLVNGALLLIDYGFPRREFYHQRRGRGPLMPPPPPPPHPAPLSLPARGGSAPPVVSPAIIAAADAADLDLLGYTSQGQFLLNCGILDLLGAEAPGTLDYIRASGAINKLLMPHEMGELFKVIAIGRGIVQPLLGFASGDQSRRL